VYLAVHENSEHRATPQSDRADRFLLEVPNSDPTHQPTRGRRTHQDLLTQTMNDKNFDTLLGADPHSDNPEFVEARRQDLSLAQRHRDALQFEARLKGAMTVPVDDRRDEILQACHDQNPQKPSRSIHSWVLKSVSLAAAMVLAVGLISILPQGSRSADAAVFMAHMAHHDKYNHDTTADHNVTQVDEQHAVFDKLGLAFDGGIADVTYLTTCVIDGVESLHLVVTLDGGEQFTVMMIPGRDSELPSGINRDINALVSHIPQGMLFVYAHQDQPVDQYARMIEDQFEARHKQA